jgi:SSS family solute:Na+ symporter
VDIVKKLRPATTDAAQVRIGRISAVVLMVLAMLWSTQGGRYSSIFEAINAMAADLAPPITAVFFWGVFWKRGTEKAALATLIFGFAMGVAAFIVDLPVVGDVKLITTTWGIPFMMQAWWGFCICSVFYIAVSLLTPAPEAAKVAGLTWEKPWAIVTQGRFTGWSDARVVAGLLAATLVVLYTVFH